MATEPFIGRWKAVKCVPDFSEPSDDFQLLQGCEFELGKDGSVKWHPPPLPSSSSSSSCDHADFPLFQCDAFEVLREREGLSVVVSLRFGTYRGLVIEFDVEPAAQRGCPGVGGGTGSSTGGGGGSGGLAEDQMVLTYSGAFRLNCQRMRSQPTPLSRVVLDKSLTHPYHLLPALEDGFFSDASVVTKSGKEFPVHKLLLSHSLPGISLSSLSGLDDETTEVLLRYAYGRCLPEAAEEDEEMAAGEGGEKRWTEVLDAANKAAEGLDLPLEAGSEESGNTLGGFSYCRQTFSQKSKICNKIHLLCQEVHGAANAIILEFDGRPVQYSNSEEHRRKEERERQRHQHHSTLEQQQQQQQHRESPPSTPPHRLIHSAPLMSASLRRTLRHLAVGAVKLAQLCRLFVLESRPGGGLSEEEQREVIAFAKEQVPILLKQLHRFLSAFKHCTNPMKLHVRQELAAHFVPEVEMVFDLLNRMGCDVKDVLEALIQAEVDALKSTPSASGGGEGGGGEKDGEKEERERAAEEEEDELRRTRRWMRRLNRDEDDDDDDDEDDDDDDPDFLRSLYHNIEFGYPNYKISGSTKFKSLKTALQIKDLFNLKMFHRHFVMILSYLVQERESFVKQTPAGKVRLVSWQIDHITDELPLFLMQFEEFSNLPDERLDFGAFKFCFIVGATLVNNLLCKFRSQKSLLQPLLQHACSLIQSDSFREALIDLDLLDNAPQQQQQQQDGQENGEVDGAGVATAAAEEMETRKPLRAADSPAGYFRMDRRLGFAYRLRSPPSALDSGLASRMNDLAKRLFVEQNEGEAVEEFETDMEVVVHFEEEKEGEEGEEEDAETATPTMTTVSIPCHRSVMAARCPYFRRALLSGMREDIERRIDVYDTSPAIFRAFLRFVYCGRLDLNEGGASPSSSTSTADALAELLMLADRYEMDRLKEACEASLQSLVTDAESAVSLLALADHYNAHALRSSCIEYAVEHPEVADAPAFASELREPLRAEVEELLSWGRAAEERVMGAPPPGFASLTDLTANLRMASAAPGGGGGNQQQQGGTGTDDLETIPLVSAMHDSALLESCVSQLRDVLGPLIDHDQLVQVALAADYNVNRALNFFFNGNGAEGADE